MIITVLNHSKEVSTTDLRAAIRAINRQIARDFEPFWDLGATLKLGKTAGKRPAGWSGDAVVHLLENIPKADAGVGVSFHDATATGLPYGFVFTRMIEEVEANLAWVTWPAMLSHEVLELIADQQLNLLVKGPHPDHPSRDVFHFREVCDPVQSQTYEVLGVKVSYFVLPHYYNAEGVEGGRNNFLYTGLKAFRWSDGGTIGFWDPRQGARGSYVTRPSYPKGHPARTVRERKGRVSRAHRYTKRPPRGASR